MDDVGAGPSDQCQFQEQHESAAQNQPCPITHLVSFQFDAWCVRRLVWPVANADVEKLRLRGPRLPSAVLP